MIINSNENTFHIVIYTFTIEKDNILDTTFLKSEREIACFPYNYWVVLKVHPNFDGH